MSTNFGGRRRMRRGFSLVELLVAMAIGTLLALAVTGAIVTAGRQSSVIGATASTQNSALIGLSLMDAAARNAGAGLYSGRQPICETWNAWNGTARVGNGTPANAPLPVRILSGGGPAASDTVVFTGGSGNRSLAAAPVMADAISAANIRISNVGDFAQGDIAVLGAPGSGVPCTLVQVTDAPTAVNNSGGCGGNASSCLLVLRNPNGGLNPIASLFSNEPTFGFDTTASATAAPAVLSRVASVAGGGFRQDAFTVQCGTLVRYNAFTTTALPPCTASPLAFDAAVDAIASDIVLMRAQYGVSATAASDVVSSWVDPVGATWASPSVADAKRIKAIRVVLVGRAREPDGSVVTQPCTNSNGVANTGPCSFDDAAAPPISVASAPLPAGRTWQNYRYRVHAAIFPLRTVIWSD